MSNPIVFMYRKLWQFSEKKERRHIILFSLMFMFANIFDFFPPLIIAKILNIIQSQGLTPDSLSTIISFCVLFVVVEVLFWSLHGPARVLENAVAFKASARYKEYLVNGVMDLPASWHTNHHSGDTIDKIEKGSIAIKEYGSRTFTIVESVIRLVTSYFALIYFNLSASYIALFFIILTFVFIIRMDKFLVARYKRLNLFQNDISAKVYDVISNITTVIILRIERLVSKSIARKLYLPYDYDKKTNKIVEVKWFLVSLFIVIMLFVIMWSYFTRAVLAEEIVLVGTVSALFMYVLRVGDIFYNFAFRYGDIVKWRTNVANAEDISVHFKERKKTKQIDLSKINWKELFVSNLSFSYEDLAHKKLLHVDDVSLQLRKGMRVALIGASGSGKTTTLKLLRQLYEPKTVSVRLDGKELSDGFSSISESIALIPQEPELFSTTIEENITLGLPLKKKHLLKNIDLAMFSDVVKRLPNGLDSSIVEKGVNLSGGEKQRLSLARGLSFCASKEIILLDEPTSSVDAKNELAIYEGVFRAFKQKTIISSVHRLNLLPLFDYIYFFKNGKIHAEGNYAFLRKTSPAFKSLLEKYEKGKKKVKRN